MKQVVLFCGLGTSGKDFWANKVAEIYRSERPSQKVVFIGISQARKQYWGKSEDMTDADHLLKNEITLLEIKKQFIINGVDVVIANMTMLTQSAHQLPFMRMISETELLMCRKLREQKARQSRIPLEAIEFKLVNINLSVFWMTCDEATSIKRLTSRRKGLDQTGGGLVTISEFRKGQHGFEPPGNYYPFVKIDTSDESPQADFAREQVIRSYILTRKRRQ